MKIEKTETQLKVFTPYHPELPKKARKLGGDWNGAAWVFDIRNEDMVRDMYLSIYGEFDKKVQ